MDYSALVIGGTFAVGVAVHAGIVWGSLADIKRRLERIENLVIEHLRKE